MPIQKRSIGAVTSLGMRVIAGSSPVFCTPEHPGKTNKATKLYSPGSNPIADGEIVGMLMAGEIYSAA